VIGIFLNRKNLIVLLMAIELMLLAVNTELRGLLALPGRHGTVRFSCSSSSPWRPPSRPSAWRSWCVLFRNTSSINVDELDTLKG